MWKIVVVLVLTDLAILMARLAYHTPSLQTRIGAGRIEHVIEPHAATPPFMYAGIRGS